MCCFLYGPSFVLIIEKVNVTLKTLWFVENSIVTKAEMHFVRFLVVFLLSVRDLLFLFRVCTYLSLYMCVWACRVVAKKIPSTPL